jgi:predicted protein tyrosine phosphatase
MVYPIYGTDGGQLWNASIEEVRHGSTAGKFDRIVSVCQDRCENNVAGRIPYDHFMLADGVESQQEHGGDCSYTMFEIAAENISEWVQNEQVLVHCHAGRSRSVTICAAIIACERDIGFDKGLQWVTNAQDGRGDPNELLRSHGHRYVYDNQ